MLPTSLPTPAPQKFEIELPGQLVSVLDMSKPVWHGLYYTGILSIYAAEVTGEAAIPDSKTYISIFNETEGPEFLVYATYRIDISVELIVQHMQEQVQNRYLQILSDMKPVTEGNQTVH